MYLTRDRRLAEVLDTDSFDVDFCGQVYVNRKIDKFGRFQVPTAALRKLDPDSVILISVVSRRLIRVELAG